MQFDFPHDLDLEEASARVAVLCTYLYNRHSIKVEWEGSRGTIEGKYLMVKIQGEMVVEASRIHFDGRDPGILWRGKAIRYLKEKLEIYLDTATPIGELPTDKI